MYFSLALSTIFAALVKYLFKRIFRRLDHCDGLTRMIIAFGCGHAEGNSTPEWEVGNLGHGCE